MTLLSFLHIAGTHDMSLIQQTLQNLIIFNQHFLDTDHTKLTSNRTFIPRYSKALRQGRGDRLPPSEWTEITGNLHSKHPLFITNLLKVCSAFVDPVDIVLFEGWMMGFSAFHDANDLQKAIEFARPDFSKLPQDNYLIQLNDKLKEYDHFHQMMNMWLILALDQSGITTNERKQNYDVVYQWRIQAEEAMKVKQLREGQTLSCLSNEQVIDFVDRFMSAYYLYLPSLYAFGPSSTNKNKTLDKSILKISIDELRKPTHYEQL